MQRAVPQVHSRRRVAGSDDASGFGAAARLEARCRLPSLPFPPSAMCRACAELRQPAGHCPLTARRSDLEAGLVVVAWRCVAAPASGEPGAELVPAGVPERGGAEQQHEPPPLRQLPVRGAGYVDGTAAMYGAVSLTRQRQAKYIRQNQSRVAASAGEQQTSGRRLHARPVRRRAHAAIHHLHRDVFVFLQRR